MACVFSLSFSRVEGHGEEQNGGCVELRGHHGLGVPAGSLAVWTGPEPCPDCRNGVRYAPWNEKEGSFPFLGSFAKARGPRTTKWGPAGLWTQKSKGQEDSVLADSFIRKNIRSKRHTWEYCYWKEHFAEEFL